MRPLLARTAKGVNAVPFSFRELHLFSSLIDKSFIIVKTFVNQNCLIIGNKTDSYSVNKFLITLNINKIGCGKVWNRICKILWIRLVDGSSTLQPLKLL